MTNEEWTTNLVEMELQTYLVNIIAMNWKHFDTLGKKPKTTDQSEWCVNRYPSPGEMARERKVHFFLFFSFLFFRKRTRCPFTDN